MPRRLGLPLQLQHPSHSEPNYIPLSMRTEHTEGVLRAVQARPGTYHANQDNLGYPQNRGFQSYPGYQEYRGYQGYDFYNSIPVTANNNSLNNQQPGMAELGYGVGPGQGFDANGWPLEFIQ